MELKNDFEVSSPASAVWGVFSDVERIAPCLPGAQLQEVEGEEFKGIVKVKVGPITTQYKGVATFLEQDESAKKIVIKAEGRDTKGAGNASAVISVQMESLGDSKTKVFVSTDLSVTGKVAQFGRGVMADISSKLIEQFVDNLQAVLAEPDEKPAEKPVEGESKTSGAASGKAAEEPEAVDILAASSSRAVRFFGTIAGFFYGIVLGIKKLFRRKPKAQA